MSPKVLWDVVRAAAARAGIDKLAPYDAAHRVRQRSSAAVCASFRSDRGQPLHLICFEVSTNGRFCPVHRGRRSPRHSKSGISRVVRDDRYVTESSTGWQLRAEGRRPRSGELSTFSARVRALASEAPLPSYVERQLRPGGWAASSWNVGPLSDRVPMKPVVTLVSYPAYKKPPRLVSNSHPSRRALVQSCRTLPIRSCQFARLDGQSKWVGTPTRKMQQPPQRPKSKVARSGLHASRRPASGRSGGRTHPSSVPARSNLCHRGYL